MFHDEYGALLVKRASELPLHLKSGQKTPLADWHFIGNELPQYGRELIWQGLTDDEVSKIMQSLSWEEDHHLWRPLLKELKMETCAEALYWWPLLAQTLQRLPFYWWVKNVSNDLHPDCQEGWHTFLTDHLTVKPRVDYTLTTSAMSGTRGLEVYVRRTIDADGTEKQFEGGVLDLPVFDEASVGEHLELLQTSRNGLPPAVTPRRLVRAVLPDGHVMTIPKKQHFNVDYCKAFEAVVERERRGTAHSSFKCTYIDYVDMSDDDGCSEYYSPCFVAPSGDASRPVLNLDGLLHQYDVVVKQLYPKDNTADVYYLHALNMGTGQTVRVPVECLTPARYDVASLACRYDSSDAFDSSDAHCDSSTIAGGSTFPLFLARLLPRFLLSSIT